MNDNNSRYMKEISHRFRRTFIQGGSVAITLPPEAGFKAGDGAAWRIEDDKLILSKATISNEDIRYTKVDRKHRKNALLEWINNTGESVKEDFLLARFAIDNEISLRITFDYRDELLNDGLIRRVGDTLQTI